MKPRLAADLIPWIAIIFVLLLVFLTFLFLPRAGGWVWFGIRTGGTLFTACELTSIC